MVRSPPRISNSSPHPSLPRATQIEISSRLDYWTNLDRGAVKESNQQTASNRAQKFIDYLASIDFHDYTFRHTSPLHREQIFFSYALAVLSGDAQLDSTSNDPIGHKTLTLYLQAAADLATKEYLPDPRYPYDTNGNRIGKAFFPRLAALLAAAKKWARATSEALPLSSELLHYLASIYHSFDHNSPRS